VALRNSLSLDDFLRRSGVKGVVGLTGNLELADRIQPTVDITTAANLPRQQIFAFGPRVVAVAAEFSQYAIRATGAPVSILSFLQGDPATLQRMRCSVATNVLAAATLTATVVPSRFAQEGTPASRNALPLADTSVTDLSDVVGSFRPAQMSGFGSNAMILPPEGLYIPIGSAFIMSSTLVNVSFETSVIWREHSSTLVP